MDLHIISAGAAQGLVEALRSEWTATTGVALQGSFGAVGAMREQLLAGAPCDVLVLTQAMQEALARDGFVAADTIHPLGRVFTGVAVPSAALRPEIADADALRRSLLGASAIYFPDPKRATAGIHFAKVLETLGIADAVAPRLRPYPNGATAMREMAGAHDLGAIGCTQVTEIRYTEGVDLVGLLPKQFELSTVYSVAVGARAGDPVLAQRFARMLTGPAAAALRTQGGFVPMA